MASPPDGPAVGPYRIEATIGEGGMGVVYRGLAPDGSPVAIKRVRSSLTSQEALARFEREAAVRVEHPNVVRVLDSGVDTEGPYIVFELLDGESLGERLRRGRMTRRETLELGRQVCAGLAAAHDSGVVHRDIKPSNLFLTTDGTLKILDFGVARLGSMGDKLTRSGQVVGTLAYLSPEQAERRAEVDHRTDLWSLGAVLYECLAGRPPFHEDSPLATLVAVMLGELRPVSAYADEVGGDVEQILARLLSKSPDGRYPDARAVSRALEAALESDGAVVDVPPTLRPDEQRAVVLLYAEGVRDEGAVAEVIRSEGGVAVSLPDARMLGVFGQGRSLGLEVPRATAAAVRARPQAARVAVSAGRATGSTTGITGTAIDAAESALRTHVAGVAISAEAARDLRELSHLLTPVSDDCLELVADEAALASLRVEPAPAPLIGRELELAQLGDAVRAAFEDREAQLVGIVGPPGVGKTRLANEALASLGDARVIRAQLGAPRRELGLWVAIVRAAAEELEGSAERRARGLAEMAGVDDPAALAGSLRLLLSAATATATRDPLASAPTEIQLIDDRLRVAIADWVLGLAAAGLVLMVEDAHHVDARSLTLLDDIVDRAYARPLVIVLNARPELLEEHPDALGRGVTIALRGLRRGPAARLAAERSARELPDALTARIVERSEGNPFFIEQIVRALPDEVEGELPLPVSVETAVQARLDALASRERELCKAGSVFGRPFELDELEALGAERAELGARALRRRGLWAARGQGRVDFASSLVRDVAYRLLVAARRAELHRAIAGLLRARGAHDAEEVATHLEASGDAAGAAERYVAAALDAARRGDAETILRASDRAIALAPDAADRFELRMARADALRFRGSREAQRAELEAAIALADAPLSLAQARSELCVSLARAGERERALEVGEAAVEAARTAGDAAAVALATGRVFLARLAQGDLVAARAQLDATRAVAAGVEEPHLRALLADWEGQLEGAHGHLAKRTRAFREAAALHAAAGDLRRAAGAQTNLADGLNRVGAYEDAERALRDAVDACVRVGHRTMEGYARTNLAYSLIALGRPEEASAELTEARAIAERIAEPRLAAAATAYAAKAELAAGHAVRATETAALAVERARDVGFRAFEVTSLAVLGKARLASDDPAGALDATAAAVALMDELGGVEEGEASVYLAHADALEASGDPDAARAVLARGAARLDALADALPPELRAGYLDGVAAHRALRVRAQGASGSDS